MPKVSLITCTYWRPDLLRRAIQSVQKQPFEDYEHIIISDHCPFAKHVYNDFKDDKRIKFYEVEAPYIYNLGAISFNLGIEKAQSSYICYLLDDDIIYENHLFEHYNQQKSSQGNPVHLKYDTVVFEEPTNTAKSIVSTSINDLTEMALKSRAERNNSGGFDVSAISHSKNIGVKWIPQCNLGGHWEDNVFMHQIGINNKLEPYTNLKVSWGGIHRKDTKGLDLEYYNILTSKLENCHNSWSGYKLDSDTPYAYPDLKNTLYG